MEGFSYVPLAQGFQHANIRLLDLEPRQDIVAIRLSSASLEDRLYYEALSYTWGNINKTKKIKCNEQWVTVHENLYIALRHLRHVDRARTLWIDAICINQENWPEKSAQISMMPRIYEMAQRVLVWIGQADDQTKRTFSEIRRIAAVQGISSFEPASPTWSSDVGAFRGISKDLSTILLRDWFKRIWVIQEVSLCRDVIVVCGTSTIEWDELSAVIYAEAKPGKVIDGWRKTSYAIFEQRKGFDKSKRPHLSQLIVRHQDSLSTKAEDKVYALLGLADELSGRQITIDYGLTVKDIYQRVVVSCLACDQNLALLGSIQNEAGSLSTSADFPSWVPDWSLPRKAYALTFHDEFASMPAIYTAAKQSKYTWKQPRSKNGLILSGFRFDRVSAVGYADTQNINIITFNWRQYLKSGCESLLWHLSCERLAGVRGERTTYITDEEMLDVYWQTICAGCTLKDFNIVREEFLSFHKAMASLSILHKFHLSSSSPIIMFLMLCFFIQNFIFPYFGLRSRIIWHGFTDRMVFKMGRRMARTSKGYIGLVPATSRPGDCVWLFEGGNVPFVLREDGKSTRLIGDAYVHGVMRGEAFDKSRCEDREIL